MRKQKGFTLIEVMMTVVIVAILAAIAFPKYTQYVVRNNRVSLQGEMMRIAGLMELRKAQQLSYTMTETSSSARLLALGSAERFPSSTNRPQLYTITLDVPDNGFTWVLRAVPFTGSMQARNNDGALALDNLGRQCWQLGNNSGCATEADRSNAANAWNAR